MRTRELAQLCARVSQELKNRISEEAKRNRRSQTAEISLLIEEGLKWRKLQNK